ncbi:MAG: hypothetical protein ACKV22_19365 [Bryobacteraceae bacterium]
MSTSREWLNVELAQTLAPRVDLAAWLEDDALFHLEFQSSDDTQMPLRMLEYYVLLLKRYGQPPRQTVLYIGNASLRMASELNHPRLQYSYQLADVGEFDAEELLARTMSGRMSWPSCAGLRKPECRAGEWSSG